MEIRQYNIRLHKTRQAKTRRDQRRQGKTIIQDKTRGNHNTIQDNSVKCKTRQDNTRQEKPI